MARNTSVQSLLDHIPRYIYAHDDGMSFGELFAATCNGSQASAGIYRSAIEQLIEQKMIVVKGDGETLRRAAAQIRFTDQLIAPNQRSLFISVT